MCAMHAYKDDMIDHILHDLSYIHLYMYMYMYTGIL